MIASQFLDTYSTESLKVIARRRGLQEATTANKARLISFLEPRLFSRDANRRLVQSLPARQRQILAALKARGNEADTVALAAAVEVDPAEASRDIQELVELGLLLYPKEGGSRRYRLGECERVWMDRTAADAVEPAEAVGPRPKLLVSAPPSVRESRGEWLLADLLVLMNHIRLRDLPPDRLHAPEEEWDGLQSELLQPDTPPAQGRPALLASLLEEMSLLKVLRGRLVPAESARRFFAGDTPSQLRGAFEALLGAGGWNEFRRIPEIAPRHDGAVETHFPSATRVLRARGRVVTALRRFDPGCWYAFSALLREVKSEHPDFLIRREGRGGGRHYLGLGERVRGDAVRALDLIADWDRVEGRFIAHVLADSLEPLGVVSLGMDPSADLEKADVQAFRITPAGAHLLGLSSAVPVEAPAAGGLVVQPDFELLFLAPNPDPSLFYDLFEFAEYRGRDRVARFHLNRDAAVRGFRSGWNAESIIERLRAATGGPTPQGVEASLRDWEGSDRRFRILTGVNLMEDPADLLAGEGETGGLTPLTDGLVRVDRGLERLLARLRSRGVEVRHFDYDSPGHALEFGSGRTIIQHARGRDWVTTSLLQRVARPAEGDASTWVADRTRLKAAVRDGWSIEALTEALETRSRGKALDLRVALRAWAGGIEAPGLSRTLLFTCEDSGLRQAILQSPSLARFLGERVASDTFAVNSADAREFRAALRDMGITLSTRKSLRSRPEAPAPEGENDAETALPFRWTRNITAREMHAAVRTERRLRFLISRAIEARRKIRVRYFDHRAAATRRLELSPLLMDDTSLTAYCHETRSEQVYRIDRVLAVRMLPERS